jgi:hypothetical protein
MAPVIHFAWSTRHAGIVSDRQHPIMRKARLSWSPLGDDRQTGSAEVQSGGDANMTASAKGQGQVFQAGRDIVISGRPHANTRKLTVLNIAAAAQVLTDMASNAAPLDEAVVIVADMEPEAARLRLHTMSAESAPCPPNRPPNW